MNLRPYQETGRDFLASRRHALLADEMRVGKTPQAILAAEKIGAKKTLVICPAIAVAHWYREWNTWGGPAVAKVGSYDWMRRHIMELTSERYDLLIVDEAHFAKNPTAQRTKMIYGKGGLGWVSDRIWALSGTPAPKHAAELWPMLRAFGVVGMTYDEFVRRYCYQDINGVIRGTRQKMIPELRELLSKVMLRRTRKEVAPEMPAIDYQFLEVESDSTADLPMLATFEPEWIERHAEFLQEDRIAVALAKVPAVADNIVFAIENGLLNQTVVFGWHREPLRALTHALYGRGLSVARIDGATSPRRRVEIQDDFRHGKIQVIVANIIAAGTAIDLSAASHGYFLELDWVPANNQQAANRLISMQKSEPVTIDVATLPDSMDDRVQRALVRRVQELSQLY